MDKPLVQVETEIHADVDSVWDVLTQDSSAMFMGAKVETDWSEGSPISFSGEFNGKPFKDHGEIRTIEKNRRLAFTHYSPTSGKPDVPESYNLVDVELEPERDERTRVRLSQSPMGGERPDAQTVEKFRQNWTTMLEGLKKAAEQKEPASRTIR